MGEARTHRWSIDRGEIDRHIARRGRAHAYPSLDPARTALVVVDMIPFFVDANPYALGIVPNVNRLAAAARGAGGVVAWVVPAPAEPTRREIEFFGAGVATEYARSAGSSDARERLAPQLEVGPGDLVLEKRLRGAFFPGSCGLDVELFRRSVDTVIVAGTVADVCCESTVREAVSLGYRAVMVADANAAASDAALDATLRTIYRSFGDVRPTDDLVRCLRSPAVPERSADRPTDRS